MMLKVENLQVFYGAIHALQGVSFHLEKGEIVALIGANGAGKSTVLNTISGILRPREGSVSFEGQEIHEDPAAGYCPQGRDPSTRRTQDFLAHDRHRKPGDGRLHPYGSRHDQPRYGSRVRAFLHACANAATNLAARFRAANSRCWQLGAD